MPSIQPRYGARFWGRVVGFLVRSSWTGRTTRSASPGCLLSTRSESPGSPRLAAAAQHRAAAGDPRPAGPDPHPAAARPRPHPGVAAAGEAGGGRPGHAVIGGVIADQGQVGPRHRGGDRRLQARPGGAGCKPPSARTRSPHALAGQQSAHGSPGNRNTTSFMPWPILAGSARAPAKITPFGAPMIWQEPPSAGRSSRSCG